MTSIRGRKPKERCISDIQDFCFTAIDSPNAEQYILLQCDELEALRLKNIKKLTTITGGKQMHISKSTFARIYDRAIKKVTDALVNGKTIRIAKKCYIR